MIDVRNLTRKTVTAVLLAAAAAIYGSTVYIVEIGGIDTNKYFYDFTYYRDEVSKPYVMMREAIEAAGYKVQFTRDGSNISRDVAAVISFNEVSRDFLRNLIPCPNYKRLLFLTEPPVVMPQIYDSKLSCQFGKIFTMFDDLAGKANYHKLHFAMPRLAVADPIPDFSEKKFCLLINGNKDFGHPKSLYGERRNAIRFFTDKGEFDLYGPGWDGYPAWKGYVTSKWETLKNYKFCICYENMKDQLGYMTEKLFDCLIGGCVPVYWGASNVADYVPRECFIDARDFAAYEDLYEYMRLMDRETYEGYLAAARRYLASEQAQLFSSENFVALVLDAIKAVNP